MRQFLKYTLVKKTFKYNIPYRAGGKLTVGDIKLETLTIDDKTAVAEGIVPKVEEDDDGAASDEEKQAILEDENITQV